MGAIPSIQCERCLIFSGEKGVVKVNHNSIIGDHNFCVYCYPFARQNTDRLTKKKKKKKKVVSCEICKETSKELPVLSIYWNGKLGNRDLCETCLYEKKYK